MKVTVTPFIIGALKAVPKDLVRRIGTRRTSRDDTSYIITKIGQNTEKSPEDQWRLAVTRTPVKNYRLNLVKKLVRNNDNNDNKEGKAQEKNWVSFDSSTKQRHKDQLYQSKN